MKYVYDILLNFANKGFIYDFYDWNGNDKIINVKKCPVYRVDNNTFIDFLNNKIKLDLDLFKNVNKINYLKNNKIDYIFIICTSNKALGVGVDNNGIIIHKSFLLFDDEDEVLEIISNMKIKEINYQKMKLEHFDFYYSRSDLQKKKYIEEELKKIYESEDFNKLKYIYIECFNEECDNFNDMYNKIINSLKEFSDIHENLYDLLRITYNN